MQQQTQPMSLIILGLTPGLTEVGKIKCGQKGRMIQSAKGNQFQPPEKLDHFKITTLQRGPDGNYLPDLAVHALYGEKPRKIPVRLLYDDIELNFQCRYTCFAGKTLWCYGDGEQAQRIVNMQKPGERHQVQCPCGRQEPTYDKQDKCKINSCLSVIIDGVETVGGVWKLRTTSYNSTVGILSSLSLIKRLTGGPLAGLPLNLTLNPKTAIVPLTGQVSQVWVVGIEFAGKVEKLQEIAYQQAQRQAVYAVKIEQIETDARKLIAASSVVDVESEASDIVEEFFPEQIEHAARAVEQPQRAQTETVTQPASQPETAEQEAAPQAADVPVNDDKSGILPGARRRSRRNKFPLDNPQDWSGLTEIATCGATPEQILQVRNISATGDPAKDVIRAFLEAKVGYNQLSYMTEEEAVELLGQLAKFAVVSPDGSYTEESVPFRGTGAADPESPAASEMVLCPLSNEEVSVQGHCLNGCQEREQSGFCPVVDDLDGQEVL